MPPTAFRFLTIVLSGLTMQVTACGSNSASSDDSPNSGMDASVAGDFPCPVQTVLEARCQECHQRPPTRGAPFPLETWADTRVDYGGKPVWVRMADAVDAGIMPPASRAPLSASDKTVLMDWLGRGAPPAASGEQCP